MGEHPVRFSEESMLICCQFVTPAPLLPQTLKKVGQVIVLKGMRAERDGYLRLASRSRGEYLRTHFKNMREVGAALRGLKLTKAYQYLGDVKEHKQVIPFRRFSGGVGRASQAKQFGATQGGFSGWVITKTWRFTPLPLALRSLAPEICQIHPKAAEER
jgi:hypothetical protein